MRVRTGSDNTCQNNYLAVMSNVEKYLLAVNNDKDKALSIAQDTAQGIPKTQLNGVKEYSKTNQDIGLESRQVTLVDVVQSLGDYIIDEDATIRSRAIDYLSQVIGQLHATFLSRQQIQVLCEFLCERIEDGGAVGGLKKLAGLGRFNKEMAGLTFRA